MSDSEPWPPRRLFLAGGLAAVVAGGATALASLGAAAAPRTETFRFSRGTALAAGEEARLKGFLAPAAQDDRLGVFVLGHSGTQGEAAANLALSERRAAKVEALALAMGISAERVRATGVGANAPLRRSGDQPERAYEAQLARVDVTLRVRR
jgi:outer membrane protein OmpA-like peptidoglycan-associated protein